MSEVDNKPEPLMAQQVGRFVVNFLKWFFWIVFVLTVISLAAFLVKEESIKDEAPLTRSDFQPLFEILHVTWTKLPTNRVTAPEVKAFDVAVSNLNNNISAINWAAGLNKDEVGIIKAGAQSVQQASENLLKMLSTQDSELNKNMSKIQELVRNLHDKIEVTPSYSKPLSQQIVEVYTEGIKALSVMSSKLIGWPLVAFIGIIFLLGYAERKGGIGQLFEGVQSIKIAGAGEMVFSAGQKDERSKTANEVFKSYRDRATEELTTLAKRKDISGKLKLVCDNCVRLYLEEKVTEHLMGEWKVNDQKSLSDDQKKMLKEEFERRWESLRFTIIVEDLLFNNSLTQLVEYYPEEADKNNKKVGRAWSIRYGMIGRSWRLEKSITNPKVTTNNEKLMMEWGMTDEEVSKFGLEKQTFTCVVLKEGRRPIGLFYMDSSIDNVCVLPSTNYDDLHQKIEQACEKYKLTRSLVYISDHIEQRKLDIRIYG